MGQNSKISWTHHTFNPWWGCTNVSPGCDRCYAEIFSKRTGHSLWGKDVTRLFFGEAHWREPLKWDTKSKEIVKAGGERQRVFCASMADVLDTWEGEPTFSGKGAREWWTEANVLSMQEPLRLAKKGRWLDAARHLLWNLIEVTPFLDWLVLTKRPQDFRKMLAPHWLTEPRRNVWLMTTVESPAYVWRLNELVKVPAIVHGVSWEPGLDYVDFKPWCHPSFRNGLPGPDLDWVIAGGESGPGARPFDLAWARRVRDDCTASMTAFYMKQLGGHPDKRDFSGLWPTDLRIQQFPGRR